MRTCSRKIDPTLNRTRSIRLLRSSAPIVVLLAVTTRPAHADWYNDASAIIEQVIEDDISTSVIPNAAARVPALCTYFPASIGAIQQKRYAGLHTVLRKELSDFVGDKIYLEVMALATPAAGVNPGATGSSSHINIKVLAAQKTAGKLSEQQLESATQQLTVASAAMTSRTPQVATSSTTCIDPTGEAMFAGLTSGATNQMSECAIVQPDVTQEAACAIGITVRDGMDGNNSMLVTDLQRVELAIEAEVKTQVPALDPQAFDAVRKSLQAILERLGTPSLLSADAAIAALIALGEVCNASPVCKKLAAWVDTSGAAADVGVIVGDIRRHDFGAAAKQVIGFAESLTCGDKCEDQDVLHFMSSLSVYVIDSVTSGQSAQSADGDFRAAAIALIEQRGAGQGYARRWTSGTNALKSILYPEMTLRESWRPGHLNADGSSSSRYASIEVFTFRRSVWYTQWVYLAPQLTVFDALGPFSDSATSGHLLSGAPHRTRGFLEGFVVPRLTFEVGVPALSRNLLVGLGAGFRFFREKSTGAASAAYCFWGDSCSADMNRSSITSDNFEFGVHVTYVP